MHVYLEFPYQDPHDENPPPTVDVLLRMSNGKGSQRKPVSLYNKIADSTTRLTVGALLRRLGVALDKCAENHELDADKKGVPADRAHGTYLCGSHRGARGAGSGEEEEEGRPSAQKKEDAWP